MKILNLGCGTRTCASSEVVNIDWSIQLRIKRSLCLRPLAPILMRGSRLEAYQKIPNNILVHDLSKGIPFPDSSVDVIYHSHVLEHLDRNVVPLFLKEVKRVLKEGGIHRIVVPDFERACTGYYLHIKACEENPAEINSHDTYVAWILGQSVQKEASGTSKQRPVRRFIENFFLGDARRRGQTHQWMWDRFNLEHALREVGFREVVQMQYNKSLIPRWDNYALDLDQGNEYKPGSLYMEAIK